MKKGKINLIDVVIFLIMPLTLMRIDITLDKRAKALLALGEHTKLKIVLSNMMIMNIIYIIFLITLCFYMLFFRNKKFKAK